MKDLIKRDESKVYADNEMIPLSYSGINDPKSVVYFEDKGLSKNPRKKGFIQKFPNPYYELCLEKLGAVSKKKELIEGEKKR